MQQVDAVTPFALGLFAILSEDREGSERPFLFLTSFSSSDFSLGYLEHTYRIYFKTLGDVVEEVRTVFESRNDLTVHIPTFLGAVLV